MTTVGQLSDGELACLRRWAVEQAHQWGDTLAEVVGAAATLESYVLRGAAPDGGQVRGFEGQRAGASIRLLAQGVRDLCRRVEALEHPGREG